MPKEFPVIPEEMPNLEEVPEIREPENPEVPGIPLEQPVEIPSEDPKPNIPAEVPPPNGIALKTSTSVETRIMFPAAA